MNDQEITDSEIGELHSRLLREVESGGYHLNTDLEFTRALIKGLIVNQRWYGYQVCPCRLASGEKADDLDIICPCDYRDPDLVDYGACFCALYVSDSVFKGQEKTGSIPDRRPPPVERNKKTNKHSGMVTGLSLPVWRCKVCGYLCAREQPPEICPVCKAKKERFEPFLNVSG
ncbi:ferredoxin-thioredoxin reductase catalytic domain-containing protein [Chloroflexota bacterium]